MRKKDKPKKEINGDKILLISMAALGIAMTLFCIGGLIWMFAESFQ